MKVYLDTLERFESRFDNKLKGAKIYSTWAVVAFVITLLFCLGSIILWFIKVKSLILNFHFNINFNDLYHF